MSVPRPEVVIVGAGPTGLTLAAELLAAGVTFRIIDAAPDAVHESRALAIQARTLEVLDRAGIAERLVAAGDPARVIELHARREVTVPLFDAGAVRTRYPFLLFLSQARTERILLDHLERHGVAVERETRVVSATDDGSGVTLVLEGPRGAASVDTRFLIGCDGAHSQVRRLAGIEFAGSGFPQPFAIADLEVDGLPQGPVHAYLTASGVMFFFPLGDPATWRMLGMLPDAGGDEPLDLPHLQRIVDGYAAPAVLPLRDPRWITTFTVQSRHARRFRRGRILLAGDAAHIHSPAGAQGMNTGIQDAVNLGWKLAQVLRGTAGDRLLDSYEDERLPVARSVLRETDRLFRLATSPNRLVRYVRPRLAPVALGVVLRSRALRELGFRTISQLAISYRRGALARSSHSIRWQGLRAGDRLPEVRVLVDGAETDLRDLVVTPGYLLAAVGAGYPDDAGDGITVVEAQWPDGAADRREVLLLIRPDGYLAGIWRTADGVRAFRAAWLSAT